MGAGRERIVDTCDRARGLFVMKDPEGRETRAFMVPPGRERVWEFLRTCHDSLAELVRHIHPSLTRTHHYRLAWERKRILKRL